MSSMISYAQNREDVILWRALRHVPVGRYVEVGANHPSNDSVSRAFYDHGWSGITVEPEPYFAQLQRDQRPRDVQIEAAISSSPDAEITLHVIPETGLSTTVDSVSAGHHDAGLEHVDIVVPTMRLDALLAEQKLQGLDIHFLLVDVEGAEKDVLDSIDLTVWRPWILVVESTVPNSTEQTHGQWESILLDSDYEYCLFDGLSRYYVAAEKADELRHDLSYPASVFDDYRTWAEVSTTNQQEELQAQLIHWRTEALSKWASAVSGDMRQQSEIRKLRKELKQLRSSTSCRLTRPLRGARRVLGRR